MKVFMLGWEFPPYISGGVGAACQGLTQALLDTGTDVVFMLPRPVAPKARARVHVVKQSLPPVAPPPPLEGSKAAARKEAAKADQEVFVPMNREAEFREVDSPLSPYLSAKQYREIVERQALQDRPGETMPLDPAPALAATPLEYHSPLLVATESQIIPEPEAYAPTLFEETHRYSRIALAVAAKEDFDIVHAHDWMTFEAAKAAADATGAPLVVQIHSTEFDRTPYNPDPMIIGAERAGMHAAAKVIAVSNRVKRMLVERYEVPPSKIEVVYNAIEGKDENTVCNGHAMFHPRGKLVLFLGRMTSQKGPEHFLAAAKKVCDLFTDVKFVMAGDGEQRVAMEELADDLGISDKVMFTGFLSKPEVETLFQTADVYVMPSVSEPFGIVSLEALRSDVPVIISRQSGVAELLHHVLKVDFWDTDDLANKILAVLRHPCLADTLREEGQHEIRQLTWHDAARQTVMIYEGLLAAEVVAG
jgi:glycosyltransferase involved in cell wall biosynthesis